jgi:hypothetical protein
MRTPVSGGGKELKIARTRLRKRRATNYRATARALKRSGVFANGLQGLHDFEVNQFTGLFFGERHDIVQAQENREPADLLRGHSAQGRVDARGTVKQFRQGDFFHQRLAAFSFRVSRAMQISRSVIIPSTRPFSTTGSVPQPCFQRISATTARLNLGLQNLASQINAARAAVDSFHAPSGKLGCGFSMTSYAGRSDSVHQAASSHHPLFTGEHAGANFDEARQHVEDGARSPFVIVARPKATLIQRLGDL